MPLLETEGAYLANDGVQEMNRLNDVDFVRLEKAHSELCLEGKLTMTPELREILLALFMDELERQEYML